MNAARYAAAFLGFSYGSRPGRSQHDALDALAVGIAHTTVNVIVDADVSQFFDCVSHEWLVRFVERRIGDPRILRLVRKWLKAGVAGDGEVSAVGFEPRSDAERFLSQTRAHGAIGAVAASADDAPD